MLFKSKTKLTEKIKTISQEKVTLMKTVKTLYEQLFDKEHFQDKDKIRNSINELERKINELEIEELQLLLSLEKVKSRNTLVLSGLILTGITVATVITKYR